MELRNPEQRSVLLQGLQALADTRGPEDWKDREAGLFDIVDDLDQLLGSNENEPGDVLASDREVQAAQRFADALDALFSSVGRPPTVDAVVGHQEWPRLVREASAVLDQMNG
jgi:hypothetical protein